MTREEVTEEILKISNNNILVEIPTGFGKTKIALELIKKRAKSNSKILIVIPKNVLINNWLEEIKKWLPTYKLDITFTTYVSFPKYANKWDIVIFDECHHLSTRCLESLKSYTITHNILLSATIKQNNKWEIQKAFPYLYIYHISTRAAIDNSILPDPKIILIPMELDNIHKTELAGVIKDNKKYYCTPRKYYETLSNNIDFWKRKAIGGNAACKNIWLHKAGERLKWLSKQKTPIIANILKKLAYKKTLTFCNNIQQAEYLSKNYIHSKNNNNAQILEAFNNNKIKHLTSVAMLDEGINLKNCQIGIYANLNSSERIIKQRLGRLLRHKNPVIIIPYFINTRDEEIMKQMLLDYNHNLISVLNNIELLKI